MSLLWKLEPSTAAKHRLYRRYLDAWWPILLQPTNSGYLRPRVTYLDAFAGPGRYQDGEEGSPVLALRRLMGHVAIERMHLSQERVCLVFIEKDLERYHYLRAELESHFGPLDSLPVRVEVRHGEAGRDSETALTEVGAWGSPILSIFDSWGNVNVSFATIRRIAQNPSSEILATFGPNWFSRRNRLDPEQLDSIFGGRAYWAPADRESRPDERWRVWLSAYRAALRRAGFKFQLQFEVVPRTGLPLNLVFGTGHEKGVEVMKEAMWDVDGSDGMSFRDPRTRGARPIGQMTLTEAGGLVDNELLELVTQYLRDEGSVPVEAIGRWLLCESARWRSRDARKAVVDLQRDGLVTVTPSGRLSRTSLVALR